MTARRLIRRAALVLAMLAVFWLMLLGVAWLLDLFRP